MKVVKNIIMSLLFAVLTLSHSASYAQDNEDSVFVSGRLGVGGPNGVCPGNCSADPSGTIGFGYDYTHMSSILGAVRNAVSIEYTRQQLYINGKVLDVTVKGITLNPGMSFGEDDRFTLALSFQWGVVTTSGQNIPERKETGWGGRSGGDLYYHVGSNLDLMIGLTTIDINTSTLPLFISYTTDVGLRWHL